MLLWAAFGQTGIIVRVKIFDSAIAVPTGKTGLAFSTAGLIVATAASSESTPTVYRQTVSNIENVTALGTYAAPTASKCRFREYNAADCPGVYELQFANARFAIAGARFLHLAIHGASGMAQCDAIIPLPVQDDFTAGLSTQQKADVKAQALAIFATDPQTEPGQVAPPGPTGTFFEKFNMMYKAWHRKKSNDGATTRLFAANGTTVDQKQGTSAVAGVAQKDQWVSGP